MHSSICVRQLLGRRIDRLMRHARLVIGGNEYLVRRAREAGASWVETVSTVVDLERYTPRHYSSRRKSLPCIVWIGSPATVHYLESVRQPLAELARRCAYTLRVIGSAFELAGVKVECVPWSEATEVAHIAAGDIGIMPLQDSPWEQGKCGYKLIQYMACGLPVVASPIGVNQIIVRQGENGYLAGSSEQWVSALDRMIDDVAIRRTMGAAGRRRVEVDYCLQAIAPGVRDMLLKAAEGQRRSL